MIELGYSKQKIGIEVEDSRLLGVLTPNEVNVNLTGEAEVRRALSSPIGAKPLNKAVKKGDRVVIITSDITRPMPSKIVLPPIIEELNLAGVEDKDISVIFALGSHRPHTDEEKKYLVGEELFYRINCLDSDASKCIHLGFTKSGTPIDIFEPVVNADFRICLGNIEYHYFAGYSGGAKAIMPGVSTPAAIQVNHKMMTDEKSVAGNIFSPVRQDIEEVIKTLPIHYIVNVVLDEHKKIIYAVAGDYITAHRDGCAFLDSLYKIKLRERADIVVVSAGGYPKDLNMYQAQKALDNAKHAVKDGGIIIWLAECSEGLGSATFEKWMTSFSPAEMVAEIKRDFVLGGHKAAAIGLVLQRARIFLVSGLPSEFVKGINLEPFSSLDDAFEAATKAQGRDSTVYIMPYGGSTLPYVSTEG